MINKKDNLDCCMKYMTIKDVSELTQLSKSTIERACREGKLKSYKVGRALRFKRDDIKDWIEGER